MFPPHLFTCVASWLNNWLLMTGCVLTKSCSELMI
jgi:hypothetical protein